MGDNHPSIATDEIYALVETELEDLKTDGIISSAIYNKKASRRILLYAVNAADRHIALQLKLSSFISIFAPSGNRTVFFARQKEYVQNWIEAHSDVETFDDQQFSYLVDEMGFLDVISVRSNYAHAFETLPVNNQPDPGETLVHSLAQQVDDKDNYKFVGTTGRVYTAQPTHRRFYVEPNSRKMILSEAFSGDRWIRFKAQIAPITINSLKLSSSELDHYKIMSPYWAQEWLLARALIKLLPMSVATKAGYYDIEAKARVEAFENRPGTGNVIIGGDELDGNYESDFNF